MSIATANVNEKIMVNGRIPLQQSRPPAKIQRGMKIVVKGGKQAGIVGGIIVNSQSNQVSHLLLCRVPVTAVYRLIPTNLIARIEKTIIHLCIHCDDLDKLAAHQPT